MFVINIEHFCNILIPKFSSILIKVVLKIYIFKLKEQVFYYICSPNIFNISMRRITLLQILFLFSISIIAQIPSGYYNAAVGKTEAALKSQLYTIISTGYTTKSYDYLHTIYLTSDTTSTGNIWDMYSTCTWTPGVKKCGNYNNVCDCYNREHSIPQSWFNKDSPMVSDAFHVYPTDGVVNAQRGSFPFGECSAGTTLSGGKGRRGSSTFPGYSGTVFEPDNEFKGDFARTYFYFATRYQNIMTSIGGDSFDKTIYPSLSSWSIALFLKWHRQDPVSQKELTRNNVIYTYQKNRNPFIDYPSLAEHIWGNKKGTPWSLTSGIENLKIEFSVSQLLGSRSIQIKTNEQNFSYRVLSLNGILMDKNYSTNSNEIQTRQLNEGMYIVEVQSDNRKSIKKIVLTN